jgi:hypothetical protein
MSRSSLALLLIAVASPAFPGAAWAQVAGPTPGEIVAKQQADLNRFQAQMQSDQLQQLQRQNVPALSDPNVQTQALIRQQQITQQIDQNTALQQRMNVPNANPSDISSQLQQYGGQIQQLQQQPALPVR